MTLDDIRKKFVSDFQMMDDSFGRHAYLLELAALLPPMDSSLKNESRLVKGCQSMVWLSLRLDEGRVMISADSDTLIVRGILFIIIEILSGRTADEILSAGFDFLKDAGIMETFSAERMKGIGNVIESIRDFAASCNWKPHL
jgi:cysteine desulfuration protein SufE